MAQGWPLMLTGLYSAARGMDAATLRHEVASQNLAFAQNPGHRRTNSRLEEFKVGGGSNSSSGEVSEPEESIDFSPGRYETTGRTLDLALHGDGFFVLDGPDGPLYSRNGRLHVSTEGELVTADGVRVQGRGGPLRLLPGSSSQNLEITSEGRVLYDNRQIGQLDIVTFQDNSKLRRAGASLFTAPEDLESGPSTATIVQGAYEHSNVEPVSELVSLIVASRQYEAAQQAMQSIMEAVKRHTNQG